MNISGAVVVDLRFEEDQPLDFPGRREIESKLWRSLALLPEGADVIFVVSERQIPYSDYFVSIKDTAVRARSITVQCDDPETIAKWCAALRVELLGEEAA